MFERSRGPDDETSADDIAAALLGRYKTYLGTGRWPMSWDWGTFLVAPLWALFHRNKLLAGLWVILCVYVPVEARDLSHPLQQTHVAHLAKQALVLFSPLLALILHIWITVYGYRGQIRHALRLIAKADQLHIFDPDRRQSFLAGANPDMLGNHAPRRKFLFEAPLALVLAMLYLLCAVVFLAHVIALIFG